MKRAAPFLVLLVALPPILGRVMPGIFTPVLATHLSIGVCFAAAAVSLNLLMGYTGQISLGHGAFLALGAFASGLLTTKGPAWPAFLGGPEWPILVGVVVAAVVGGLFALLVGLPALRLRGLYLAIATIAFAVMLESSVFRWRQVTGGSAGLELHRNLFLYTAKEHSEYLSFAIVMLIVIALVDRNVVRTKLGRAFQAIRADESVAQSCGVDVTRFKLTAFVLSGAMAAVAGATFGHLIRFVSASSFEYEDSLLLVVIVVVGGLGSRTGVIIASLFFVAMPKILGFLDGWDLIVGPLLLIDVVTRHPGGFAQAMRDSRQRKAVAAARAASGEGDDAEEPALPRLPALPRPAGLPARATIADGAPLLTVSGVSVAFGGLQANDNVSLTVPKGSIVGLIGPNGAGKTTLFNAISGFVTPTTGSISFMGHALDALAPSERARLGVGRTFQMIGLVKDRSVLENVLLAQHAVATYPTTSALLFTRGVARVERELLERAHTAIEALGFERFTHTEARHLSHGQQRIVELACALVTAPELLLLDEPSAGMSPAAVENLAERLRDIRDDLGRTVLLIEHNIPLVLDVCDELNVLNFGQVLASGTTAEIAARPEVIGAYFGEAVDA